MNTFSYYINSWMLLGILAFLVFVITGLSLLLNYILAPKPKPKVTEIKDIDELIAYVNSEKITKEEYNIAAESFLKFFSDFPNKKDKDYKSKEVQEKIKKIFEFLESFSKRHDTDENTLLELQKTLVKKNPDFKEEISKHISKSLKEKK